MKYNRHLLPNGVRLILTPMPQAQSVGVNVFVGTGSRHESKNNNGLSHFLEHLAFKGTQAFTSSKDVSESIEGLGGVLNAYTGDAVTNYHVKVTPEHFKKAFQVVSQLVLEPLIREKDIEDERGVILEEINRREDDPQDKVFENISQITFPDHPLGWSTLGRPEVIKSLRREDFVDYRKDHYTSNNIVVSVAGNVAEAEVKEEFEKFFASLKDSPAPDLNKFSSRQTEPQVFLEEKKTEQAHFCLSLRGLSLFDERRYALTLLNSVLGSGMSSRLFLNIREKGLAYSVGSLPDLAAETGALFVFAGFNVGRISEALSAIMVELRRLKTELVESEEFSKAREKQKGPLLFHLEDPEEVSAWYGQQEIMKGEIQIEESYLQKLDGVNPENVKSLANDVFRPENLNLAIIGPYPVAFQDELKGLLNI